MTLIALRSEVLVDYDDISVVILRPDLSLPSAGEADQSLFDTTERIIDNAKAKGRFYDVSGKDRVIRSIILTKSGLVIGINILPTTILNKCKDRTVTKTEGKKRKNT